MPRPALVTALTSRLETATLIVLLAGAGAMWAFFALAAEMLEGDLHGFDETILLALRNPSDLSDPIGGPQVEIVMRDLTALGGVTILTLISASVLIFLVLRGRHASALFLGVAIIGGMLLSNLAKLGFARPRPDLVPHGVDVATASFPSGHSMMATVTYLTLAVMLARTDERLRIRAFFVIMAGVLAVLVGTSRVYLGVHWPSDVLAGWTLGAAWALSVWLVARWLARRGRIEPDRIPEE
ncbi:phosphatase PAP2 family protein [Mesobacterium pallidum]|uniref:phosphatase PAP2 family protein n=1 Tax=Mesobacterium pallidum TaxID=2872037 RepID=UPI001EE2BACE|nr:phosphatase PAP2 family protein [Mesobacterium pallidum]